MVIGSLIGAPDGHLDADDRGAAADGAVARVRCTGGRAGRHGPLLRLRPRRNSIISRWRILAIEVLLGSLTFTGSLVAFGKLQELIPSSIKGLPNQNLINFGVAWRGRVVRYLADDSAGSLCAVSAVDTAGPGVRSVPRDADRRGRYADGDLAVEFLRRSVGEPDGLRAQQLSADHRRRARRLLGPDPVDHHVQGDEPFVHERVVRPDGCQQDGIGRRCVWRQSEVGAAPKMWR